MPPFGSRLAKRNDANFDCHHPASRRAYIFAFLVVLVLAVAGVFAFRGVGRWLVREDPLARADAIAVLSGSMPYRAEGAADLYGQGYAPEVWLTRPVSPSQELARMGIRFQGEEDYDREVLTHSGVPENAIRILPSEIVDTEDEIREITTEMRNSRDTTVIVVTSPQHTRRVRALWRRLAAPNQRAIVRAAWQDRFDRDHWWRNTRDAYAVVREALGLANTWTGLAVRPHAR
jgi:uncharacterized SAM-binding protein YcdF (DUF218 family)